MPEIQAKTDRRIIRSQEALKTALLTLMSQKPFSSISITEIVELANYNRGTIFSGIYAGSVGAYHQFAAIYDNDA